MSGEVQRTGLSPAPSRALLAATSYVGSLMVFHCGVLLLEDPRVALDFYLGFFVATPAAVLVAGVLACVVWVPATPGAASRRRVVASAYAIALVVVGAVLQYAYLGADGVWTFVVMYPITILLSLAGWLLMAPLSLAAALVEPGFAQQAIEWASIVPTFGAALAANLGLWILLRLAASGSNPFASDGSRSQPLAP
jgi:hypothetical protein